MRIRYVATIVEMLRKDAETLAREYLSARDAEIHEFLSDEDRAAYVDLVFALGRFLHRSTFEREVAEIDAASAAIEAQPAPQHLMRPIAWQFEDGTTFPGYTDGTCWNSFINVWVGIATWPYVMAELIAGADGDAEQIERYQAMPDMNGMVSLAYGFATTEVTSTWPSLFTDYPRGTMMPIPASWTEMSCRNETAPSFGPCVGPMGDRRPHDQGHHDDQRCDAEHPQCLYPPANRMPERLDRGIATIETCGDLQAKPDAPWFEPILIEHGGGITGRCAACVGSIGPAGQNHDDCDERDRKGESDHGPFPRQLG